MFSWSTVLEERCDVVLAGGILKRGAIAFKRKRGYNRQKFVRGTLFSPERGFGDGIGRAGGLSPAGWRGLGNGARRGAASRSVRVCIRGGGRGGFLAPPSPTVRRGTLLFPDGPEDGRMFRFVLVDFFGDTEGAFDRIADPTTHR